MKNKDKYRNRDTHAKEYQQQKEVANKFTATDRMRRVFHWWNNNKTEQMHGFVLNVFLPKRSYYCQTIYGKARTFLAAGIGTRGYHNYYEFFYRHWGPNAACGSIILEATRPQT
jgi:hypothetical protein